jgi:hypothetical protein
MKESSQIQLNTEQLQTEILKKLKAELLELSKNFQPKEPKEYLTRQDVAELFQVNISTVSNWKNDGVINAYGMGGRVYYKRSEIDKAMIKIN